MLHAVGSSDAGRAEAFASTYGAPVFGAYADVLAREDVDAVYIGTVHTGHARSRSPRWRPARPCCARSR